MSTQSSSLKVGAFEKTNVTGIYRRQRAAGKPTFYVRFTRPDGKRAWEACESFEHAKGRLAEIGGKLHRGEVVGDASTTVATLVKGWEITREQSVKPRTRSTQNAHTRLYVLPALGRMKVRDVNRAVVLKWLAGLKRQDGDEPLSDGTKALILATLSSILDYVVMDDLIASNPVKSLSRKSKPHQGKIEARVLGPGEFEALLGAFERVPWMRPLVQTTLLGALRLGEVCGLDWQDVDFERGVIVVRQQLGKDGKISTPKGGKVAEIVLVPDLRRILAEHKLASVNTAPDSPVFTNRIGGRRCPSEVVRTFIKARERAGLSVEPRALRFHDLRHTAISALANQPGAVLTEVQRFARHAALATTFGYVHGGVLDETWADRAGDAFAAIL